MAEFPIDKNLSPEERLKCLISYTSSVEIDPNVSAKLYYRSGLNMFKQFNVYYKESSWENATCIYLKYELLFFDKIKKHPEYNQIPVNTKSINATNYRLMKLKADHARRELFKQYKREYMSYCEELRRNRGKELLDDIKALETCKASQTNSTPKNNVPKEFGRNLKKRLSDTVKVFKGDSDLFRSKTTNLKLNNPNIADQISQETKTTKYGSEIFRTANSSLKPTNTTDQRLDSQEPKGGGEVYYPKKGSIKSNNIHAAGNKTNFQEQKMLTESSEALSINSFKENSTNTGFARGSVNYQGPKSLRNDFLWNQRVQDVFNPKQNDIAVAANKSEATKGTHIYIRKKSLSLSGNPSPKSTYNRKGSREAAFTYAISSAGVTFAITAACARGNISSCGCAGPSRLREPAPHGWKWGGCTVDIDFGTKFARKFMDAREFEGDERSLMNLHNNKAGRKIVKLNLLLECKCHGVSGSCTMKTCWKTLPTFRQIGDALMKKYYRARPVAAVSSIPNTRHAEGRKPRKQHLVLTKGKIPIKKAPKKTELVFLQMSPNYCERDLTAGSLGTVGRSCNRTSRGTDGCDLMCCGRGYNTHQFIKTTQCNCKFHWCCRVECDTCSEKTEEYTCK